MASFSPFLSQGGSDFFQNVFGRGLIALCNAVEMPSDKFFKDAFPKRAAGMAVACPHIAVDACV